MMKERGLLFTPENYTKSENALKWQTRRIMKPQPASDVEWFGQLHTSNSKDDGLWFPMKGDPRDCDLWEQAEWPALKCPYGQPGDRLYVKEGLEKDGQYIRYRRGLPERVISSDRIYPLWQWQKDYLSPLHMPKWAARLWLELTAVRVERLQEITNEDARAEGCSFASPHRHGAEGLLFEYSPGVLVKDPYADRHNTGINDCWICPFRLLWQSIHGPGSWDLNPWVWVLEYRRIQP